MMVKALIIEADESPEEILVSTELDVLQKIVGDNIQIVPISDDVSIVCGENNRETVSRCRYIKELNYWIHGTFLIIGDKVENDDFSSLSDEQISKYVEEYSL